jgi:hypothetical protein
MECDGKRGMRGHISKKLREAVKAKTNNRCGYCGCQSMRMQIDHIKPIMSGGTDDIDNLLAACGACNNYKMNLDIESLRRYVEKIPLCPNGHGLAVATGALIVTGKRPVFYFETLSADGAGRV